MLLWIIFIDEILDIGKRREISNGKKFVGHISSICFINSIYFFVWCTIGLWSESGIYKMASDCLWGIFAIDIIAKFTYIRKIFFYHKFISSISLAIIEERIEFPI